MQRLTLYTGHFIRLLTAMKKTNAFLKLSLLLFTAFAFHTCQICTCKTITCAAFTDAQFDQWVPYTTDQLLIYKNALGTADTIKIAAVQRSESYEGRTGGGYGCGRGCNADVMVSGTNMKGNNFQKLNIHASKTDPTGNGQGKLSNIYVSMGVTGFGTPSLSDTGFVKSESLQSPITTKFNSSWVIGTKTFSNVQLIQLDTLINKQAGVYKFYFARNAGLVGWENYPDKTLWIKE